MDQDPSSRPKRPPELPPLDAERFEQLARQFAEDQRSPTVPPLDLVKKYAGRVTPADDDPFGMDEIRIPAFLGKQAGGSREWTSRLGEQTPPKASGLAPEAAPQGHQALPDWLEECVQARTRRIEAEWQANPDKSRNPLMPARFQAMLDLLEESNARRARELERPVYHFEPGPLSAEEEAEVRARIHRHHEQYAYNERRGAEQSDPRYRFQQAGEHLALVEALQQRLRDAGLAPEVLPDRWSYPYHG